MKYEASLRLLNFAHMIQKSRKVRAVLFKNVRAANEMLAVAASIARRNASLICFLEKESTFLLPHFYFTYCLNL